MKHLVFDWRFLSIILFATFLRLTWLGTLPIGKEGALWLRLPVALSGIVSVFLFIYCVQKYFQNVKLALIAGLVLTLLPWHIEQSRVISGSMIGLTFILGAISVSLSFPSKRVLATTLVLSPLILYLVYPDFWPYQGKLPDLSLTFFLANIFKLISVEYLFYRNDSFWLGGLRDRGVLLSSCLPLFGLGIYQTLKKLRRIHLRLILPFIAVLFIAAANPMFPEQKEYFLISPYLALIVAFGVLYMIDHFISSNMFIKAILIIYIIFLLYDHLLFYHYYTVHYAQRIQNEIPKTEITF